MIKNMLPNQGLISKLPAMMYEAQALLHDSKNSVSIDAGRVVGVCNAFLDLVNEYNRLRMGLPCHNEKKSN